MRIKYLILGCIIGLLIVPMFISNFFINPLSIQRGTVDSSNFLFATIPPEHSREELYQDIIMTLINPYIDEAIYDYYGQSYRYDLFGVEVLEAKRTREYRGFIFKMKIHIMPFTGPHNTVGEDIVTIKISPSKTIVEKFEHIRSSNLSSPSN